MAVIERKHFSTRATAEAYLLDKKFSRYSPSISDGTIWVKQPGRDNKCQLWARVYINIDNEPDDLEDVSRCYLMVYERSFNDKQ
jgi:hypothetical protein